MKASRYIARLYARHPDCRVRVASLADRDRLPLGERYPRRACGIRLHHDARYPAPAPLPRSADVTAGTGTRWQPACRAKVRCKNAPSLVEELLVNLADVERFDNATAHVVADH